jgi:pyruvate kinase
MIDAGVDIIRLNFSHGAYDEHAAFIRTVREEASRMGRRIPIIQDLSGPRGKTTEGHAFDDSKAEITEKDLADLDFGIKQQVDYIAQSYVGTADDVRAMRAEVMEREARIPIIAKIERVIAVQHIDAIIAEADAIMVARGDLGNEEPLGEIPFVERDIIAKCNAAGKSVIVATQMLYSMIEHPEPTRAEVTDEAFAIISGADAVMLSDETARGKYPVEAVRAMETIALRAEANMPERQIHAL